MKLRNYCKSKGKKIVKRKSLPSFSPPVWTRNSICCQRLSAVNEDKDVINKVLKQEGVL